MTLEKPLDYQVSTADRHIICSPDAISGIANSLERLGAKRALVVCGPSILEHSNVVQRVQKALGDRCIGLYSGVAPHLLLGCWKKQSPRPENFNRMPS